MILKLLRCGISRKDPVSRVHKNAPAGSAVLLLDSMCADQEEPAGNADASATPLVSLVPAAATTPSGKARKFAQAARDAGSTASPPMGATPATPVKGVASASPLSNSTPFAAAANAIAAKSATVAVAAAATPHSLSFAPLLEPPHQPATSMLAPMATAGFPQPQLTLPPAAPLLAPGASAGGSLGGWLMHGPAVNAESAPQAAGALAQPNSPWSARSDTTGVAMPALVPECGAPQEQQRQQQQGGGRKRKFVDAADGSAANAVKKSSKKAATAAGFVSAAMPVPRSRASATTSNRLGTALAAAGAGIGVAAVAPLGTRHAPAPGAPVMQVALHGCALFYPCGLVNWCPFHHVQHAHCPAIASAGSLRPACA